MLVFPFIAVQSYLIQMINKLINTATKQEIVQSIQNIDAKMYKTTDLKEFAELEHQLAKALEQMLRQVTQKTILP